MNRNKMTSIQLPSPSSMALAALVAAGALLLPGQAMATTISGTVSFQGSVQFLAPIAGISATDLTVAAGADIQATGNGEHCDIVSSTSAPVDGASAYPASGTVSMAIEISHGGMVVPDGGCLVQLRAYGDDGANVSAKGAVTVEVTAADVTGNATVVVADDIVVHQSKTHAGLDKLCNKWVMKQLKLRNKCNETLLKFGGTEGAIKCKTAGDEPLDCDPANYVEDAVALSFGDMDQQTDPPAALAVDIVALSDQRKCQHYISMAARNFFFSRNKLVLKTCVTPVTDSEACRLQAAKDSAAKLALIDNCVTAQGVDVDTTLVLPDVAEPCRAECISGGVLDRKCLKTCLDFQVSLISDGLIGDIAECGNGILQAGEFCDDGNLTNGDCCASNCKFEPAGSQTCGVGTCEVTVAECSAGAPVVCTPGTPGTEITASPECSDGLDNDCDTFIDGADLSCN